MKPNDHGSFVSIKLLWKLFWFYVDNFVGLVLIVLTLCDSNIFTMTPLLEFVADQACHYHRLNNYQHLTKGLSSFTDIIWSNSFIAKGITFRWLMLDIKFYQYRWIGKYCWAGQDLISQRFTFILWIVLWLYNVQVHLKKN